MGPLTWQEMYRHIVLTCAQSGIVTGMEPLVLEEPVLKRRAHVGALVLRRPPPLAAPPTLSEVVEHEMRALARGQDERLCTADALGRMIRPMG